MDWNNLLSGLLGAVVGSITTLVATIMSNKHEREWRETDRKEANKVLKHEESIRSRDQDMEYKNKLLGILNSFRTEIDENIAILSSTLYEKTILSKESWNINKGEIGRFPNGIKVLLVSTYSQISRYNSLLEEERVKVPYGNGGMDGRIQRVASEMKTCLESAKKELMIL